MTVYAHINTVPNGSTGGIMLKEHNELLNQGEESYAFWGRGRNSVNETECRFTTNTEVYLDALQTRIDGRAGFHSKKATTRLLAKLEDIQPDVVHLHNLHGYYVNIEMLFNWLARNSCKILWTLHDCWAFTGHCACREPCCQLNTYPKTFSKANCSRNFTDKKKLFTCIPADRLTLITPSYWLKGLVKQSFLRKYSIEVRHNAIDTTVFKPTPSDFRERYGIKNRFMILGVASPWTERKGLSDFIKLAHVLNAEEYAVVLVGLSRKQMIKLSKTIYSFPKIKDKETLAKIYSAADVFLHPGVEETYGLTVAEACACGTATIVSKNSACEEAASDYSQLAYSIDMKYLVPTIIQLKENKGSFTLRK